MDKTAIDVSAALAGVRRQARLLEEARGTWSWRELTFLPLFVVATFWMWSGSDDFSNSAFGSVLVVATVAGWQHQRLRTRVDALTKLLTEIGYPREA
jgi:Zn-dependent protease with chaperone function